MNPYNQPTYQQMQQMQSDIGNNIKPTAQQANFWAYVCYGTSQQAEPSAFLVWNWPEQVRLARMQILLNALGPQN